jgi:hypothetical protein
MKCLVITHTILTQIRFFYRVVTNTSRNVNNAHDIKTQTA